MTEPVEVDAIEVTVRDLTTGDVETVREALLAGREDGITRLGPFDPRPPLAALEALDRLAASLVREEAAPTSSTLRPTR